jgi:hypothetical protein
MTDDTRDLLAVLKKELEFLEEGGYRNTTRAPWRPNLVFQDSPTCLNFASTLAPRPCSECILTQLAPEDMQRKKFPCRYILLNERGETIDSFYRSGTQEELEPELRGWLKATIERIEGQKAKKTVAVEPVETTSTGNRRVSRVDERKGTHVFGVRKSGLQENRLNTEKAVSSDFAKRI